MAADRANIVASWTWARRIKAARPLIVTKPKTTNTINTHQMLTITHSKSPNSDIVNSPSDSDYSREELVAELTAAFLCAEVGIENTVEQSAAYIASWLNALEDDEKLLVHAAAAAQKASDYVLGIVKVASPQQPEKPYTLDFTHPNQRQ